MSVDWFAITSAAILALTAFGVGYLLGFASGYRYAYKQVHDEEVRRFIDGASK